MLESDRSHAAIRITYIGLVINIVLTAGKLIAGIVGSSSAMVADSVHSLSDFATDIVVIVSFLFFVSKPRDTTHSYGHGKFETMASLVIGGALLLVGLGIAWNGGHQIWRSLHGEVLERPGIIALVAAAVSIVLKEILYRMTARVADRIQSDAVRANAWHHRSDAFSSIGTMIGIGGAIFLGERFRILDPIAGVVVSVFIIKVAIAIAWQAISELLETALPEKSIQEITATITAVQGIRNIHNVRTRKIGNAIAVDAHILVDPEITVAAGHAICTDAEEALFARYGRNIFVTLHVEPWDH